VEVSVKPRLVLARAVAFVAWIAVSPYASAAPVGAPLLLHSALAGVGVGAVCGDGVRQGGEGCDDGDVIGGDGCSSTCAVEYGWQCSGMTPDVCVDLDGDGVLGYADNCPSVANPDQADLDSDAVGDACDDDLDGDGVPNGQDNCALVANPDQADLDGDTLGDVCDVDVDGDGVSNAADNCLRAVNADQADADADGIGDACDDPAAPPPAPPEAGCGCSPGTGGSGALGLALLAAALAPVCRRRMAPAAGVARRSGPPRRTAS
jgi:MYXO-CTERM domain-containing protein